MTVPAAPPHELPIGCRGSMHQRLREATSTLHEEVERRLDLLRADLTRDRYRRTLQAFYGYYAPLEQRLDATEPMTKVTARSALVPLRRTPLIERDLIALGTSSDDMARLPRCTDLPTIASPCDRAGCLYVIEGASLGGRVISRFLERTLGIRIDNGGAFFTGDDSGIARRWASVLSWIEAVAAAEESGDAIVAAASDTFETLGRWFDSAGRPA